MSRFCSSAALILGFRGLGGAGGFGAGGRCRQRDDVRYRGLWRAICGRLGAAGMALQHGGADLTVGLLDLLPRGLAHRVAVQQFADSTPDFVHLLCWRNSGRSSPYRHQPVCRHLEFRRSLLNRGGVIRRLDGAKPDGFCGDPIDAPPDRLRRRFGLAFHTRSISRARRAFNPAD